MVVDEGATISLDISLAPEAIEMEAITVSAEREQGSTAFLLDQRAGSVSLMDAVGAAEIRKAPGLGRSRRGQADDRGDGDRWEVRVHPGSGRAVLPDFAEWLTPSVSGT